MLKFNKVKLIVGTLSVVSVASVVGSIAGTVAWYQYNTRVTATYLGTSSKCTENLQIRIHDDSVAGYADAPWVTDLRIADTQAYLANKIVAGKAMGSQISPVTVLNGAEGVKKDGEYDAVKSNPIRQHFAYTSWVDATSAMYVVLPLQVKLIDVDGSASGGVFEGREVFLSDLTLVEKAVAGKKDISDALRAHIDSYTSPADHVYSTWSKQGKEIDTNGYLDLDGDNILDRTVGYEWEETVVTKYGAGTQTSYATTEARNSAKNPMADDTDAYLAKDNALVLGETNEDGILNINVTIWLEGWQKLLREDVSYIAEMASLDAINGEIGTLCKDATNDKLYAYDGTDWAEVAKAAINKASFEAIEAIPAGSLVLTDGEPYIRADDASPWETVDVEVLADPALAGGYEFSSYTDPVSGDTTYYKDGVELDPASDIYLAAESLLSQAIGTTKISGDGHAMRFDGIGWDEITEISTLPTLSSMEQLVDPVVGDTYLDGETGKLYRYLDDGNGNLNLTDVTDEETDPVWDASSYIGAQFNVGFRFAVDAL